MSEFMSEMINENKDIKPSIPPTLDLNPEPKVTDSDNENDSLKSKIKSNVRQRIFEKWAIGDQMPLCRTPINGSKTIKKSPKKSPKKANNADIDHNSEEYKIKMKTVEESIDDVVKRSDSVMDDWVLNQIGCPDSEPLIKTMNEKRSKSGVKTCPKRVKCNSQLFQNNFKVFSANWGKNNEVLGMNVTNWQMNVSKTNCYSNDMVINDITVSTVKSINEMNGSIGQQMTTNAINDKKLSKNSKTDNRTQPKARNKSDSKANKKLLKINTNVMFKGINPFHNNFQTFLSQPSKPKDTSKSAVSSVVKKYSERRLMAEKRLRVMKSNGIKIKRNRTKPLVIKNILSQKSFLDFVGKKFPPIKEGVPFIQDRSCKEFTKDFKASDLTFCLDCNDRRNDSQTCRFYQYRTLIKNGGKLSVYAFAEQFNATQEDSKVWLPFSPPKALDAATAKYLMTFVSKEFCNIYSNEQNIAKRFLSLTWKKPVKGIRELCDVCLTTIFNIHYVCPDCGFAVCVECFDVRKTETASGGYRKNHDEFGWIYCNQKQKHNMNSFHLANFITQPVFGSVNQKLHSMRNELQIMGVCECHQLNPILKIDMRKECNAIDLKALYPHVPQRWLCDDRLLVLTEPDLKENLALFQIFWLKGYPVMIEGVHRRLSSKIWRPESFNESFGKQTSRLVNCMDGSIISKRPMSDFWNGFEDVDKRLSDDSGVEMILKLKDWPPNAEFRDILPIWFDDLMAALPLPEYTRYDGKRNLASRLSDFFVRPDLGPKMYCAFGSVLHPEKGTTNLHLDMSDAVNVMIYVGVAQQNNQLLEEHLNRANDVLLMGGCNEKMMERIGETDHKVGALWHIWRAEDAITIRHFLQKVAKERNMKKESNNDPIHDQSWYLDETLRTRLEKEHNIKGLAIAQCLGDSILVPAGAPHQVQNIHSCIKVAGEFVSPENVDHCLSLTQEFRQLSKRHNNHEDKLQVKNIIYHTIKDSIASLLHSMPVNISPQQPLPHPVPQPNGTSFTEMSSMNINSVTPYESQHSESIALRAPTIPPIDIPINGVLEMTPSNCLENPFIKSNAELLSTVPLSGDNSLVKPNNTQSVEPLDKTDNCLDVLSPPVLSEVNHKLVEELPTDHLSPPPILQPFFNLDNSNDNLSADSLKVRDDKSIAKFDEPIGSTN